MLKKPMQLGLPMSGGGPTNPGYPTTFRPAALAPAKEGGKARPVLTTPRAKWLLELYRASQACRRRGKVQQDCMALGWTEWVKDVMGGYVYGLGRNPSVLERLTPAGLAAIAHLIPQMRAAPSTSDSLGSL
jgi:hypothetical protein